jgi:hypothetical protein
LRDDGVDIRVNLVERASVFGQLGLILGMLLRLCSTARKDEGGMRERDGVVGTSSLRPRFGDEVLSREKVNRKEEGKERDRGTHENSTLLRLIKAFVSHLRA